MDLSIIIVSWNSQEKLRKNLEQLFNSSHNLDLEIFVVDNNSQDNTVEMIKQEFLQVKLIENKENFGFAKANNQAIRKSKGDFVLLLNPDMLVQKNTLQKMFDWMKKNKQASVASCHLVNEKNKTIKHIRNFPKFFDQVMIILKIPHIIPFVLNNYICSDFDYNKSAKVDSVRGSFFMIKREMLDKIGGLDERYFIWFEEVDFCKQVYENNGEVWYTNEAKCIDFIGQSFNLVKKNKKQKYFRNSMLNYFRKWHSKWEYLLLKFFWKIIFIFV